MRAFSLSSVLVIFAASVGCGGADDTSLFGGGPGIQKDGGAVVTDDSGTNPALCALSRCGLTVPAGFALATAVEAKSECPNGFAKRDGVADPAADGTACSCTCNVTQQPDCSVGVIHRNLDYNNSPVCGTQATTINVPQQGCNVLQNPIQTSGWHYSATVDPSGGACSYDVKVDNSKLTWSSVRLCEAPANCQGAVCGANVCVTKDGDVACPTGFPQKRLVGKSASIACGACGACTLDAACGGTLSFYTDYQCSYGQHNFPVDGTCNATGGAVTYYSYELQGVVKKADCGGASSPPTLAAQLNQPSTVCCQK